ncbi:hypothetical protein CHUAL_011169 [Chamberlinius hualienensis]
MKLTKCFCLLLCFFVLTEFTNAQRKIKPKKGFNSKKNHFSDIFRKINNGVLMYEYDVNAVMELLPEITCIENGASLESGFQNPIPKFTSKTTCRNATTGQPVDNQVIQQQIQQQLLISAIQDMMDDRNGSVSVKPQFLYSILLGVFILFFAQFQK